MAPTPTPTPSPAPSGDDFPVVVTGKVGGVRRSVPVWSGQKAVVLYLLLAQSIAQARSSVGGEISDTGGGDSGGPGMDWGWPHTLILLSTFVILALAPEKYRYKLGFLLTGAPMILVIVISLFW